MVSEVTEFKRRFIAAVGSSAVVVSVRVLYTLFQVPILLSFWNKDVYGSWIAMMAAIAYVSILDFGLPNVVTIRCARFSSAGDDRELANTIVTSAVLCLTAMVVSLAIGLLSVPWLSSVIHGFGGRGERYVIPLFFLYASAAMFSAHNLAVLRGCRRFSQSLLIDSATQITELAFNVIALVTLRDPVFSVIALIIARVAMNKHGLVWARHLSLFRSAMSLSCRASCSSRTRG
jgi:O-antigen/teichoic acid export membrane protein